MAETEKVVEKPVEYRPPSRMDAEELAKAFEEEGIVQKAEPAKPPPPVEEKKAEAPPAPAKAEEELPAITKIAAKQAEYRKLVEQHKPYIDAIQKAERDRDPVAALAALGFTPAQYAEKMLTLGGKSAPAEEPEAPKRALDPEIEELRKFKAQYESEKASQARNQALQGIEATVKKAGDKFKHLAALEKWDAVEQVIINYHAQHNALPGDTFEESVVLAAEVVEGALKQEAQKWQKLYGGLTSAPAPATVPNQKAPESPPSTGTETARTLTNSNTTAPAAVRPVPKSREEILAAIIEGRDDLE